MQNRKLLRFNLLSTLSLTLATVTVNPQGREVLSHLPAFGEFTTFGINRDSLYASGPGGLFVAPVEGEGGFVPRPWKDAELSGRFLDGADWKNIEFINGTHPVGIRQGRILTESSDFPVAWLGSIADLTPFGPRKWLASGGYGNRDTVMNGWTLHVRDADMNPSWSMAPAYPVGQDGFYWQYESGASCDIWRTRVKWMRLDTPAPVLPPLEPLDFSGELPPVLNASDSTLWILDPPRLLRFRAGSDFILRDTLEFFELPGRQPVALADFQGQASVLFNDGSVLTAGTLESPIVAPNFLQSGEYPAMARRDNRGRWNLLVGGRIWRGSASEWRALEISPSKIPPGEPRLVTGTSGVFAVYPGTVRLLSPSETNPLAPLAGFADFGARRFSERHGLAAGIRSRELRLSFGPSVWTLELPSEPVSVEVTADTTVLLVFNQANGASLQRYRFQPGPSHPNALLREDGPPVVLPGQAAENALWSTPDGEILLAFTVNGALGYFSIRGGVAQPVPPPEAGNGSTLKRMQDQRLLAVFQKGHLWERRNGSWVSWKDFTEEWESGWPETDPVFSDFLGRNHSVLDFSVTPDDRASFLRRYRENFSGTVCGDIPKDALIGDGPFPIQMEGDQISTISSVARHQGVTYRAGPFGLTAEGVYSSLSLPHRVTKQPRVSPHNHFLGPPRGLPVHGKKRIDAVGRRRIFVPG